MRNAEPGDGANEADNVSKTTTASEAIVVPTKVMEDDLKFVLWLLHDTSLLPVGVSSFLKPFPSPNTRGATRERGSSQAIIKSSYFVTMANSRLFPLSPFQICNVKFGDKLRVLPSDMKMW